VGSYEFYQLTGASQHRAWWGIGLGAGLYIFFFLISVDVFNFSHLVYLLPVMVLLLSLELFVLRPHFALDFARVLMGWVYVVLPMALITTFSFIPGSYSPWLPLGFFILLWVNDSGAYLVGSSLGKTKLFERVSPKKTWEGMIGGLLATIAVAWVYSKWGMVKQDLVMLSSLHWIIIGVLVSVFGTLGDLVESHLKRTAGVKDSGILIPGHGGVLDRFDGYLLSLPMVYTFVYLIHHI
jgi:phosphatidate cytidylyltransferase